jgi:hypothetical protein
VMEVTAPLIAGAEAAAALAARMRLDALGEAGDPEVRAALDQVVSALADPSIFGLFSCFRGLLSRGYVTARRSLSTVPAV